MMTGRKFLSAWILGVCGLIAFGLLRVGAADTARSPPGEGRRVSNERVLRGVLTIYVWKMTDAVKLTHDQAARLFPEIRETFRARWRSAEKRRELLQLFRQAIEAVPADEAALKRLLEQWEENEAGLNAAREHMRKAMARVLTPEQQARSLLFEEEFERDLVRVIADMRRERSQSLLRQDRGKER